MLNLAPWYYKKLFTENDIINKIEYFELNDIFKIVNRITILQQNNLATIWQ